MRELLTTPSGDKVIHKGESVIIEFTGKRNVVSTSNLNGGYREDLQYAFNNSCGRNPLVQKHKCPGMKGKTLGEHYSVIASEIGLPPEKTTGMGTAALMENMAIVSKSFDNLTVMALATAGIDVNGGSAGDLARHNEFTKQAINQTCGTINIFLLIDAKLPAGVLTRAQMTATEAKSAAIRELAAPSMYSEEPATGSGTDSLIAIGNLESDLELHGAGKHCILGQLIGQSVKEAVKEALKKQSNMTAKRQASIVYQGKRYGITEENLYKDYCDSYNKDANQENYMDKMTLVTTNNLNVSYIVPLLHLIDQHRWGMINAESLNNTALLLINSFRRDNNIPPIEQAKQLLTYKEIIDRVIKSVNGVISHHYF